MPIAARPDACGPVSSSSPSLFPSLYKRVLLTRQTKAGEAARLRDQAEEEEEGRLDAMAARLADASSRPLLAPRMPSDEAVRMQSDTPTAPSQASAATAAAPAGGGSGVMAGVVQAPAPAPAPSEADALLAKRLGKRKMSADTGPPPRHNYR